MDGAPATNSGGGGGPAPFLLKTYDMVDDSSTDEIVSWSSTRNSFVVWNPPEFARLLLPTYFKHNNFSSFIRQLNTYGFRKIDPEKWEFANEDFVKDRKHLLRNIHRRKPIHSHSNPQGSTVDPERAAFEEEIEKLSREKATMEANLLRSKQQQPAAKLQLEQLTRRVLGMEQRQDNLLTTLEKAIQNPDFIEHLARKLESMDFSSYNKKRRLPQSDNTLSVPGDSFVDNSSSSRPEFGNIYQQDLSNKLTLELSHSTQSSNEDGGSPMRRDPQTGPASLLFAPETLELSDTGASFNFNKMGGSSFSSPGPGLLSLQQSSTSNEDIEGHISCHLNLTLASAPLQVNKSQPSASLIGKNSLESRSSANVNMADVTFPEKNRTLLSHGSGSAPGNDNQVAETAPPPGRVNDVFWEQFLTERPGASETEEASSNFRANPYEEQDDRRAGHGFSRNYAKNNMDQLSL
ncbi:hypothetical protein LguiB_026603 [Lonicera macranthoides]